MKKQLIVIILVLPMFSITAQKSPGKTYLEIMQYFRSNYPEYEPVESFVREDLEVCFHGTSPEGYREVYTFLFAEGDSCYLAALTTSRRLYKKFREEIASRDDLVYLQKNKWRSREDGSTWLIARHEQVVHIVNFYEQ